MSKRPLAKQNLAADVETKRIDIPDIAKIEIARMSQNLDKYVAGIAVGLGIKGKWSLDVRNMQFVVQKK